MFSLLTVVMLVGLTGCISQHGRRPWACMGGSCAQAPENGEACQNGVCEEQGDPCVAKKHCCPLCKGRGCQRCCQEEQAQEAGPATGAVAYPYYTVRGPRDFLAKNPGNIGP